MIKNVNSDLYEVLDKVKLIYDEKYQGSSCLKGRGARVDWEVGGLSGEVGKFQVLTGEGFHRCLFLSKLGDWYTSGMCISLHGNFTLKQTRIEL